MKNNKGFTLIELLVAIALMLTILGIAIVNFINISDRKKEEAWESVKSEIEIAAEQYFKANEYLFEGMATSTQGYINVGILVQEDYINLITNPKTGQSIDPCIGVYVTKNNGVFKVEMSDEEINKCNNNFVVSVKDVGAPNLSITENCEAGKNGWCRQGKTLTATATPNSENNSPIIGIGSCNSTSTSSVCDNDEYTYVSDVSLTTEEVENTGSDGKYRCFKTTNALNLTNIACGNFKVDNIAPEQPKITNPLVDSNGNVKWSNVNVTLIATTVEKGSGIDKWSYSYNQNSDYTSYDNNLYSNNGLKVTTTPFSVERNQMAYLKVCDNAGNCSLPSGTQIKIDKTKPTCDLNPTGTKIIPTSEWYTSDVTIAFLSKNDPVSKGVSSGIAKYDLSSPGDGPNYNLARIQRIQTTDTNSTIYTGYVVDNAGNVGTCSEVIKRDTSKPTCTLEASGTKTNNWYTSDVLLKFGSISDSTSDIQAYNISSSATENYENPEYDGYRISSDVTNKTYYGYVKDNAGNSNKCLITINRDTVAPSCENVNISILSNKKYNDRSFVHENFYSEPSGVKVKYEISGDIASWKPYVHIYYNSNYDIRGFSSRLDFVTKNFKDYSDSYVSDRSKTYNITDEGIVSLYAEIKDSAGNTNECYLNDGFVNDTKPPKLYNICTKSDEDDCGVQETILQFYMYTYDKSYATIESAEKAGKFNEELKRVYKKGSSHSIFGNNYYKLDSALCYNLYSAGTVIGTNIYFSGYDGYYGSGIDSHDYNVRYYNSNYTQVEKENFYDTGGYIYIDYVNACDNVGLCSNYNYDAVIEAYPSTHEKCK